MKHKDFSITKKEKRFESLIVNITIKNVRINLNIFTIVIPPLFNLTYTFYLSNGIYPLHVPS